MVGQTIGSRLVELGHDVRLGARSATNDKAAQWTQKTGARASHGTFAEAAQFGSILFNCTQGGASLDALAAAGKDNVSGKTLIDVANPLTGSRDRGATLLFCDRESLGERIQAAYPDARVVKTLNTMWCGLMVRPRLLPESHNVFVCGNDAAAKEQVVDVLQSFGWNPDEIADLGDISGARGTEMLLPVWLRIWERTGNGTFNFRIVR
jgi:predicted dinucleotide-binding enzyme